jgi:hypothetical protein
MLEVCLELHHKCVQRANCAHGCSEVGNTNETAKTGKACRQTGPQSMNGNNNTTAQDEPNAEIGKLPCAFESNGNI